MRMNWDRSRQQIRGRDHGTINIPDEKDKDVMADIEEKYLNKGALFRVEHKSDEKHADYSGNLNINGVDYWLDGWIKESAKTQKKFLSLRIKPKANKPAAKDHVTMGDEIPF
jgi:hypothetical protein